MVQRKGFFTPEMGFRLREIQVPAGLTQDEVGARMGMAGKGQRGAAHAIRECLVVDYVSARSLLLSHRP